MTGVEQRPTGVVRPGQPEYDEATRVFNLAAPLRPAAAIVARDTEAVRAAVRYARAAGLAVRTHSTGHGAATAAPMDDVLLIRTLITGGVRVDAHRRRAWIPAGTCWDAVIQAAAEHGLAAPHGSSPQVGVVGYLLRGGVSFYGRHRGLAVNSVRAVELVTADGRLRRVDADTEPDLFWALRGGGGGFGVVTAVEIELFPVAGVVTGAAFWPVAHAAELIPRWQRWAEQSPWTATTSLRVMRLPDVPGVIDPELSAGPVLCVDGVVVGPSADDVETAQRQAEELLRPLRSVAAPLRDSWRPTDCTQVPYSHLDPVEPLSLHGDHMLLGELGERGAGAFLAAAADPATTLINVELRQLGGAFASPVPGGGALDHVGAAYAWLAGGAPGGPLTLADVADACARVRAALRPWDTGSTVPSLVENVSQPQRHLTAARLANVDRVRLSVDPDGVFRSDVSPGATALS
ncbi:FAD-binding oxidoreductase [Micromonospora gifhornensis]|uniref:FAD-binding oxidoreductase n=1 Tax=Micromonospora gifhornensis TaxID=84594 RepID=UPI003666756C